MYSDVCPYIELNSSHCFLFPNPVFKYQKPEAASECQGPLCARRPHIESTFRRQEMSAQLFGNWNTHPPFPVARQGMSEMFCKEKQSGSMRETAFFLNNRLSPILYCLSLPDKPFPSSSVCVLLCLSYCPLDSHNLIEIPPIRGVKSTRTLYSWKYHSKSTSTQK